LRSAVPLCYAHWEGFIKNSSHFYGVYVSNVTTYFSELKPCFFGEESLGVVAELGTITKRVATASLLVDEIFQIPKRRSRVNLRSRFENVGNLNFDLFLQCIDFLGIDSAKYLTRKNFIDEVLLSKRNSIAHGSFDAIDKEAGLAICDEVIGLIRQFKSDIEDAVTMKSYLA